MRPVYSANWNHCTVTCRHKGPASCKAVVVAPWLESSAVLIEVVRHVSAVRTAFL